MEENFWLLPVRQGAEETETRIKGCEGITRRFGLSLTAGEIAALSRGRGEALGETGRVEFGPGIAPALILAFCDSPYLTQSEYADTLLELQTVFYHLKNETRDRLSDDELLRAMRRVYDGPAGGAAEYLAQLDGDALLRAVDGEEEDGDE